jgi:hypothetical protein
MKIPAAELDLVRTMKRRQMRLPVENRPPRIGRICKLWAADREPITITVSAVRKEPLEAISRGDARREGYASRQGAIDAFRARYGDVDRVFVIDFLVGRHEIKDQPIYLARRGSDYTVRREQAMVGEPEVMVAPGESEKARIVALAKDLNPQYEVLSSLYLDLEKLRESLKSMKARRELRRAKYALDQIEKELRPHQLLESLENVAS